MGEYSARLSRGDGNPLTRIVNSDLSISSIDGTNEDDQAESVDSGCVPDLTSETSWSQVSSALGYEYSFISSLLLHTSKSKYNSDTSISQNISKINETLTSTKRTAINKLEDSKKVLLKEKLKDKEIKKDTDVETPNNDTDEETTNNDTDEETTNNENAVETTKENTDNTRLSAYQKIKIEHELRKLKRGKFGNLTASQGRKRMNKIRKQLSVNERRIEKEKKNIKKEQNAAKFASSNKKTPNDSAKKIYNSNGKLVYSKFDFSDNVKEKWKENNKPDLNYYMNKVIKEKEKLKSLETEGKIDQAVDYLGKKLWSNAMKKAQGEKVRDDTPKLKRALEKKKQQKKKSHLKWEERVNAVKKSQEKSQDTKKQNFISRKQKQQQRSKGKKKKEKNARVPGF